jgi:hypothetical protein
MSLLLTGSKSQNFEYFNPIGSHLGKVVSIVVTCVNSFVRPTDFS